jgi:hypothetical protein
MPKFRRYLRKLLEISVFSLLVKIPIVFFFSVNFFRRNPIIFKKEEADFVQNTEWKYLKLKCLI